MDGINNPYSFLPVSLSKPIFYGIKSTKVWLLISNFYTEYYFWGFIKQRTKPTVIKAIWNIRQNYNYDIFWTYELPARIGVVIGILLKKLHWYHTTLFHFYFEEELFNKAKLSIYEIFYKINFVGFFTVVSSIFIYFFISIFVDLIKACHGYMFLNANVRKWFIVYVSNYLLIIKNLKRINKILLKILIRIPQLLVFFSKFSFLFHMVSYNPRKVFKYQMKLFFQKTYPTLFWYIIPVIGILFFFRFYIESNFRRYWFTKFFFLLNVRRAFKKNAFIFNNTIMDWLIDRLIIDEELDISTYTIVDWFERINERKWLTSQHWKFVHEFKQLDFKLRNEVYALYLYFYRSHLSLWWEEQHLYFFFYKTSNPFSKLKNFVIGYEKWQWFFFAYDNLYTVSLMWLTYYLNLFSLFSNYYIHILLPYFRYFNVVFFFFYYPIMFIFFYFNFCWKIVGFLFFWGKISFWISSWRFKKFFFWMFPLVKKFTLIKYLFLMIDFFFEKILKFVNFFERLRKKKNWRVFVYYRIKFFYVLYDIFLFFTHRFFFFFLLLVFIFSMSFFDILDVINVFFPFIYFIYNIVKQFILSFFFDLFFSNTTMDQFFFWLEKKYEFYIFSTIKTFLAIIPRRFVEILEALEFHEHSHIVNFFRFVWFYIKSPDKYLIREAIKYLTLSYIGPEWLFVFYSFFWLISFWIIIFFQWICYYSMDALLLYLEVNNFAIVDFVSRLSLIFFFIFDSIRWIVINIFFYIFLGLCWIHDNILLQFLFFKYFFFRFIFMCEFVDFVIFLFYLCGYSFLFICSIFFDPILSFIISVVKDASSYFLLQYLQLIVDYLTSLGSSVYIIIHGYAYGFLPHQTYGLDRGGLVGIYRILVDKVYLRMFVLYGFFTVSKIQGIFAAYDHIGFSRLFTSWYFYETRAFATGLTVLVWSSIFFIVICLFFFSLKVRYLFFNKHLQTTNAFYAWSSLNNYSFLSMSTTEFEWARDLDWHSDKLLNKDDKKPSDSDSDLDFLLAKLYESFFSNQKKNDVVKFKHFLLIKVFNKLEIGLLNNFSQFEQFYKKNKYDLDKVMRSIGYPANFDYNVDDDFMHVMFFMFNKNAMSFLKTNILASWFFYEMKANYLMFFSKELKNFTNFFKFFELNYKLYDFFEYTYKEPLFFEDFMLTWMFEEDHGVFSNLVLSRYKNEINFLSQPTAFMSEKYDNIYSDWVKFFKWLDGVDKRIFGGWVNVNLLDLFCVEKEVKTDVKQEQIVARLFANDSIDSTGSENFFKLRERADFFDSVLDYELDLLLRKGLKQNRVWFEQNALRLPFLSQCFPYYVLMTMVIIITNFYQPVLHTKVMTEILNVITYSTKVFGIFVYSAVAGVNLMLKLSTMHRRGVLYADYKYVLPQYKFNEVSQYEEYWFVENIYAFWYDYMENINSMILFVGAGLLCIVVLYLIMYNYINFKRVNMYLLYGVFNKKKRPIL